MFIDVLKYLYDINPDDYMRMIQKNGRKFFKRTAMFEFSDKPKYKIKATFNDGNVVYFGASDYKDFLIYRLLEKMKKVKEGTAYKRQDSYLARALKIRGKWNENNQSRNYLAIVILWQ